MRDIIQIAIGQAGISIADLTWQLLALEHQIQPDGTIKQNKKINEKYATKVFFNETPNGVYVPKSIFFDMDPVAMNQIRRGPNKSLYNPSNLLSGNMMQTNEKNRTEIDYFIDRLVKLTEGLNGLQGFMVINSIGGGTSSHYGEKILQKIKESFPKKQVMGINIFPSPTLQCNRLEIYNSVLMNSSLVNYLDTSIVFDNEAFYRVYDQFLPNTVCSYSNINKLIAQLLTNITSFFRYESKAMDDLCEFRSQLCPINWKQHFLQATFSPLTTKIKPSQMTFDEIATSAIDKDRLLSSCQIDSYTALSLLFRGEGKEQEIKQFIKLLNDKNTINFVENVPNIIKGGFQPQLPFNLESEIFPANLNSHMICNSPQIVQIFKRMGDKFDKDFSKRLGIHHYVSQGMEEGLFSEARENLSSIINEYGDQQQQQQQQQEDNEGYEEA